MSSVITSIIPNDMTPPRRGERTPAEHSPKLRNRATRGTTKQKKFNREGRHLTQLRQLRKKNDVKTGSGNRWR
jgi:hypothetical protein